MKTKKDYSKPCLRRLGLLRQLTKLSFCKAETCFW